MFTKQKSTDKIVKSKISIYNKWAGSKSILNLGKFLFILAILFTVTDKVYSASAYVDDNYNIVINGKPTFLFGFFHVSHATYQGTDRYGNRQRDDITHMSASGFDSTQLTLLNNGDWTDSKATCDTASDLGFWLFARGWNGGDAQYTNFINAHKDKPAIIGWYIADDFNIPIENPVYTPAQLRARHDFHKNLAPNHLTYAAGFALSDTNLEGYAGNVDVVGLEQYYIGNWPYFPNELEAHMDDCIEARKDIFIGLNTTIIGILQTFAWSDKDYPTVDEQRNMIYAFLINRFKGVMGYAYYDGGGFFKQKSLTTWNDCTILHQEIKQLENVYLHGYYIWIDTGIPKLYAAAWLYQDKAYVIIVNTERENNRNVSIPLPYCIKGTAITVFGNRPSGMTNSEGLLTGQIKKDEVHVYKFNSLVF